jgi:hypothetical protein
MVKFFLIIKQLSTYGNHIKMVPWYASQPDRKKQAAWRFPVFFQPKKRYEALLTGKNTTAIGKAGNNLSAP